MSGLWARYNKLLDAQPLLTKALTSLTGFTLGDILAQKFIEPGDKPYDLMRTIRLGSFGFLLHGTTGHYFYGFLDSKLPGTAPMTVATKVAIDQTIWNPIFGCMFFGYLNVMEGKSFDDYVNKIKADLKTAVMGSWAVSAVVVYYQTNIAFVVYSCPIFFPHPLTCSALCLFSLFVLSLLESLRSGCQLIRSTLPLFLPVNDSCILIPFRLDTMSSFRFWVTRRSFRMMKRRKNKQKVFLWASLFIVWKEMNELLLRACMYVCMHVSQTVVDDDVDV